MLNMKWQDKVPQTEVLDSCRITGLEAMLMRLQVCWFGHVYRMPDGRVSLPKQLLYGQLTDGILAAREANANDTKTTPG